MTTWRIVIVVLIAAMAASPGSFAAGKNCPSKFNSVDFGTKSAESTLLPRGTRLRTVFNNRFLLQEDALLCEPGPERLGDDGLPIPIVRSVTFADDVLRRPTARFVLKGHNDAMARQLSSMMVQVQRQAIATPDLLRPVAGGECYTQVHNDEGVFCIVSNPLVGDAPFVVTCSHGSCATGMVPAGRGLSMELEWRSDGASPAAMAGEIQAKIAEVYVFLTAVLSP